MSGHTPGPWTKKGTQIRKGDFYLASSRQSGLPPQEAAANARLIAAAPELLAALEALEASPSYGEISSDEIALWDNARAVIAKAKGQP